MEPRDRLANVGLWAAAAVVWVLVGLVLTTRDPRVDPTAGFLGAALIGLAVGLTVIPLWWLALFARQRRIAYRGDWVRAIRRGGWVGLVVVLFVVLRLQGLFQVPIALFVIVVVFIAEAALSSGRP
jgi:hypothetical protein